MRKPPPPWSKKKRTRVPTKGTFSVKGKCLRCGKETVTRFKNGSPTKSHRCA